MISIDPKWAFWFNIVALVLSVVAGAAWWSDILGVKSAGTFTGILNTVVTAINAILSAYSSPKPGIMLR